MHLAWGEVGRSCDLLVESGAESFRVRVKVLFSGRGYGGYVLGGCQTAQQPGCGYYQRKLNVKFITRKQSECN